jgi:hypothetical protein
MQKHNVHVIQIYEARWNVNKSAKKPFIGRKKNLLHFKSKENKEKTHITQRN